METIIVEYLTKAGVSPSTAILALLLWQVHRQLKMLENILKYVSKTQEEARDQHASVLKEVRAIREGGGNLSSEQAIHLFYQISDKTTLSLCKVADDLLASAKRLSHADLHSYAVEKFHDEMRKFIAATRHFQYNNRPMTEFSHSSQRRWQYMIDETVNKIYLAKTGDKAVDLDWETQYDTFRSRLQGSFRQWMDTAVLDTETFEREFAERARLSSGEIEYIGRPNGRV